MAKGDGHRHFLDATSKLLPAAALSSARRAVQDLSLWLHSHLPGLHCRVLTLGLLGHRVVSPGCVGGDLVAPGTKPERELYFRWWQLAVFLPVLQFSVLPSDYNDDFELTKVNIF
ncbi:hypothetical protein HPB51_001642 [Rhipicephalus microplus]|uniref:Uncharacterized protein n=1 Tax=Rhipicephalus microplus TaxID=6941 RepID=A0A9J6EWF4_RHIMP|nr:hypothetical protein HPB51_001642 [Rhipicephalus microplus]